MSKSLLRNTSSAPITLPPPYTGIIAPGDAVVLDDPPSVVVEAIGIVPELINFLVVTQVPDAQPVDGHDRTAAAAGIARALASLNEPLDLNGQQIVNVADPTDPQDVATKAYVDAHGGGGGGGSVTNVSSANAYLTVANGTTTPVLTVNVGTGATEVAAGTDSRFNPAPSVAGAVVYDTGAGYAKTAAGSVGQVLKAGAGGLPEWGADSTAPSGPAGGSLAGTYPNPSIAAGAISNNEVSASAAIATTKLSGLVTDISGNGLTAFVSAQTQVARTYYVAVNGNDTNDGSLSKPFLTLQAAHDEAPDDGTFVQILVGPGDFSGNLNITRRNTLIQGAGHRAEMFATKLTGNITVNPVNATNRNTDMVGIAGCFVSAASGAAAVKATGSALYSLIFNDCYLYTNSTSVTASAFACDATQRPRIIANECILATELAGPSIIQLDRGDVRMDATQIRHNSNVTSGAAGNGIAVLNDATLWLNGSLVETRTRDAGILATGAATGTKLTLTNTGVTTAYAGAENTTHGITVGNTGGGLAALLYQPTFNVADTSGVYAINGTGAVVYADLNFVYGTNATIAPAITLLPSTETHGTMNLPSLTASLPLKLNASKTVTAAAISLSGDEVTNTLPVDKGGTGISTTPPAGAVAYGNGSTQAYTAVGTSGQALLSSGTGAPAFGALNLSTAANITGTLPKGNQEAQDVGGDLSGTTAAATVTGIQGNPVKVGTLGAGDAGKVLTWSGSEYEPATITPGGGGGGGGGGLAYYLNYGNAAESPAPAGDKELSLTFFTTAANTPAITAPNSGVYATLAEFVSPVGEPGITTTPPGLWDVAAYLLADHTDSVFFRAVIYKWDGASLSSPIATSQNVELTAAGPSPELFTASVYVPQTTFSETERLVIRLEVTRTTPTTHTVTGYFGNGYPSHAHTTLGAPGGTGLVKVVDGIVQAPATLLFNADVDANAAIVVSKLDGNAESGATNKVLHGSNTVGGPAVWGAVALGSDVSGQLPVPNGGTGLSSGTSGGVPYFNSTSTMASSNVLSTNALVMGGGAGMAPATPLGLGTSTQVLHGNASGAPTWAAVDLAASVTGTLPIDKGGTGTNTAPAAGSVIYASSATAYSSTTVGTAGDLLQSNGMGAPSWVATLAITQGGTGNNTASPNQVPYANSTGDALLYTVGGAPGEVLGIGALGTPEWMSNGSSPTGPAGAGGVGDLSGNYPNPTVAKINGTAVTPAGGTLDVDSVLRVTGGATAEWGALNLAAAAAVANQLPVAHGGTGVATATAATIFAGPATGVSDAPSFRSLEKTDLPSAVLYTDGSYANPAWITSLSRTKITGTTTNALLLGNGASGITEVGSLGTSGQVLTSQGEGLPPQWLTPTSGTVTSVSSTNSYLTVANGSGAASLTLNVGTGSTDVAAGNDSRFNVAPSVGNGYLAYTAAGAWGSLAPGSANTVLRSDGSVLAFGKVALATDVSGTLPAGNLPSTVVYTDGSYANPSWVTSLAGSKITGNISGNADNVTGTVAVTNGGTGTTTAPSQGGVIYGASTTAYGSTAAGVAGYYLRSDGTNAPTWAEVPYDVAGMVPGQPTAGRTVFYFKATRAFTLSSTGTDHVFTAETASSGTATFTVTRTRSATTVTVMTAEFTASVPTATITVTPSNTDIIVGDIIKVVTPAPQDATLADIYWTLSGRL